MLAAGGLVAAAALRARGHDALLLALGSAALVVLGGGLALRWSAALAVAIGLLGAQQAVRLALGPDELDAWTPVVAGGLLLTAELAWWSVEPRAPAWAQPGLAARRLVAVVTACVGATIVAGAVVVAAGARIGGGVGLELAGVVAAIAALALVAWIARRAVG